MRQPDTELDPEASARLAAILRKNDEARLRAGLTEEEAVRLNLQLAREALARRRRRR